MKGAVLVMSLFMLVVVVVQLGLGEAINCGEVGGAVAPCVPYLTQGGDPSGSCCDGVKKVVQLTPTQQDRQDACECMKAAAAGYSNLKPDAASNLPSRCGVTTAIQISPTTNCKSVP